MISLPHYLILGAILFLIGMAGVLTRRNAITVFMSLELMFNAVNLTFLAFSRFFNKMDGHVIVFFIIAVVAAEAAVGLAIVIAVFRKHRTINLDELTNFRH